jgi:hypothetical protein
MISLMHVMFVLGTSQHSMFDPTTIALNHQRNGLTARRADNGSRLASSPTSAASPSNWSGFSDFPQTEHKSAKVYDKTSPIESKLILCWG